MAAKCWLWPNRIINKADSGKLRDEHNAAVNEHDIMKAALEEIKTELSMHPEAKIGNAKVHFCMHKANAALERLKP